MNILGDITNAIGDAFNWAVGTFENGLNSSCSADEVYNSQTKKCVSVNSISQPAVAAAEKRMAAQEASTIASLKAQESAAIASLTAQAKSQIGAAQSQSKIWLYVALGVGILAVILLMKK